MEISDSWTFSIKEISDAHFKCTASNLFGNTITYEGADVQELENKCKADAFRIEVDIYNKLLSDSFCERRALKELHVFLNGCFSINGDIDGWLDFYNKLMELKKSKGSLEKEELECLERLIQMTSSVL